MCMSGPPWGAGNTAESIALALAARQRIGAPRGLAQALVAWWFSRSGAVWARRMMSVATRPAMRGDVGEEQGTDGTGDLAHAV